MKKSLSFQQVKTVVLHEKAATVQKDHGKSRKAAVNKILVRKDSASARVQRRVLERNQKKARDQPATATAAVGTAATTAAATATATATATVTAENTSSSSIVDIQGPMDNSNQSLVLVENMRSSLKEKIRTYQRLRKLFAKMDVDANGLLSKQEFETLVSVILKIKSLDNKKLLALLWDAAHGKDDEIDITSFGNWLRLDGATLLNQTKVTVPPIPAVDESAKKGSK